MSLIRILINLYRKLQYTVYGRLSYGLMKPGQQCSIDSFKVEENHGDIVHPCVRYIPDGYEGHCWWMVYTPYYGADSSLENPILCYAESNSPKPPKEWKVYCEVKGKPTKGYNSDPVLFYDKNKLYVFWREYGTESAEHFGHSVATFGGVVKKGRVVDEFGPIVWSNHMNVDAGVSPAFILKDNTYLCLAMHVEFYSEWLKHQCSFLKNILSKFLALTDLLGLGGQQRSYGIARWTSDSLVKRFNYEGTIKFLNCNKLYRPWHVDFFEHENILYAIIQSNQCNADICLAKSEDGINFRIYDRPLMTNKTCNKVGIYKPTGGIVGDKFYLYYTAQDIDNRKLNKLYLTEMDWNKL